MEYKESERQIIFKCLLLHTPPFINFCLGNTTQSSYINTSTVNTNYLGKLHFERSGYRIEYPYGNGYAALKVRNPSGTLRFVSCGLRGIQQYTILKFLSAFDNNVRKWIVAAIAIISVCSVCLLVKSWKFVSNSGVWCMIKLLLEQGDPFPVTMIEMNRFRIIICATLLSGVVISNAFKSTNIYTFTFSIPG